jgi:transposase-like protein
MKIACPYCCPLHSPISESRPIRRIGEFWRKSDGRWISRFQCLLCKRGFSQATNHSCYRQNKRHKNQIVRKLLSAGVSQREIARVTGLNRKTIVRKLLYWAQIAQMELEKSNQENPQCKEVEFDDLETFEHTKCKPLSVTLMVEYKTRRILGFQVSLMPSKGLLAAISKKKYGPRRDGRPKAREMLFSRVKSAVQETALIRSDSNPHYVEDVKKHFPKALHQTIKGKRGAITGQGELKKIGFDPLFSLNHTCAMLRANINRLFRRTWCTTKRPDRLAAHILVYSMSHNQRIAQKNQL